MVQVVRRKRPLSRNGSKEWIKFLEEIFRPQKIYRRRTKKSVHPSLLLQKDVARIMKTWPKEKKFGLETLSASVSGLSDFRHARHFRNFGKKYLDAIIEIISAVKIVALAGAARWPEKRRREGFPRGQFRRGTRGRGRRVRGVGGG